MNKDFLTKFNFISNILILFLLIFGGLVWADSNGIWFEAKDILGGVFGADEASQNFSFIGEVIFDEDIYISQFIKKDDFSFDIEETSIFRELEINQFSGENGNVVFVLGNNEAVSSISYLWEPRTWSICSVSCGGGVQSRVVDCINSQTNQIVGDSFCSGSKPSTSRSCNTQSCSSTESYSWITGSYGSCSVSCGGGTQSRSVSCRNDQTGAIVSDSFCSGSKPSTSRSCNTQSCIVGSGSCSEYMCEGYPTCGGHAHYLSGNWCPSTWSLSGAALHGVGCSQGNVVNTVSGEAGIISFQCRINP